MAVTSVDLDPELLQRAQDILGPGTTKAAAIRTALEWFNKQHDQRELIQWLAEADPLADLRDPEVRAAARR